MRRPLRLALAAAGLLAAAACHDAPSESAAAAAGVPQTLLSRFQGNVSLRYTAELSTLDAGARGTFVYTSTWGRRGSGPCDVTNCGNVVYVWSVGANGPTRVDSLDVGDVGTITTTGDVQVSDDGTLLVVATEPLGSLVVYSLADPAHPKLLSRYFTSDLANGVHTAQVSRVGGKLYAFCSIDPRNGAKARLTVVDLSDPASPKQVFTRVMGNPFVHDVYVRDGYLFTALWDDGITIWDIGARGRGSPSAPDSVSNVRTVNGQVHNLYWNGGRWLFAGEEGPGASARARRATSTSSTSATSRARARPRTSTCRARARTTSRSTRRAACCTRPTTTPACSRSTSAATWARAPPRSRGRTVAATSRRRGA